MVSKGAIVTATLMKAEKLVNGERGTDYGDMEATHQQVGRMWEAYLDLPEGEISSSDVAQMMSMLKKVRARYGKHNADNFVDDAGYTAIAAACSAQAYEEVLNNMCKAEAHLPTLDEMTESTGVLGGDFDG
jgi:hypothetical protein